MNILLAIWILFVIISYFLMIYEIKHAIIVNPDESFFDGEAGIKEINKNNELCSLDLSLEYDASYEEFIGDNVEKISNGNMYISPHTKDALNYLSLDYNILLSELHMRHLISNKLAMEIFNNHPKEISLSFGGFYWKDKQHKEHI